MQRLNTNSLSESTVFGWQDQGGLRSVYVALKSTVPPRHVVCMPFTQDGIACRGARRGENNVGGQHVLPFPVESLDGLGSPGCCEL